MGASPNPTPGIPCPFCPLGSFPGQDVRCRHCAAVTHFHDAQISPDTFKKGKLGILCSGCLQPLLLDYNRQTESWEQVSL